jgi:hypothetical protein
MTAPRVFDADYAVHAVGAAWYLDPGHRGEDWMQRRASPLTLERLQP